MRFIEAELRINLFGYEEHRKRSTESSELLTPVAICLKHSRVAAETSHLGEENLVQ
jgi:hypothetical protein